MAKKDLLPEFHDLMLEAQVAVDCADSFSLVVGNKVSEGIWRTLVDSRRRTSKELVQFVAEHANELLTQLEVG